MDFKPNVFQMMFSLILLSLVVLGGLSFGDNPIVAILLLLIVWIVGLFLSGYVVSMTGTQKQVGGQK